MVRGSHITITLDRQETWRDTLFTLRIATAPGPLKPPYLSHLHHRRHRSLNLSATVIRLCLTHTTVSTIIITHIFYTYTTTIITTTLVFHKWVYTSSSFISYTIILCIYSLLPPTTPPPSQIYTTILILYLPNLVYYPPTPPPHFHCTPHSLTTTNSRRVRSIDGFLHVTTPRLPFIRSSIHWLGQGRFSASRDAPSMTLPRSFYSSIPLSLHYRWLIEDSQRQ